MSLNNLSIQRPGDLGRRAEALAAIQEAASVYRELAAARPDAFRPNLAASLNNLSPRLTPGTEQTQARGDTPPEEFAGSWLRRTDATTRPQR